MEITSTGTTANTASTTASKDNKAQSADKTMGKEDFLKLFTSQLKYQDPMNPQDSSAFTAQLAQFSMLEQQTNMNQNIEKLIKYENSLSNVAAAGLIGKTVTMEDDTTGAIKGITFKDGGTYLSLTDGKDVVMNQVKNITATQA